MIHRSHRFHGRTSLNFVYSRGQTIRSSLLALKYVRNTRRQDYRVAVVVSRKVHKSAVVRNRIRRRLYEVMRELGPQIRGSFDLVFTVFNEQLAVVEAVELRAMMTGQLQKAGILHTVSDAPSVVASGSDVPPVKES